MVEDSRYTYEQLQKKQNELTRSEWLEQRRSHIGASEVSAIVKRSPYMTPLMVYGAKVLEQNESDKEWLAWGREFESGIANRYAYHTGRGVEDLGATEFQYHPEWNKLAATLDRLVLDHDGVVEPAPLELKNTMQPDKSPKDWDVELPIWYEIQNQMQIACFDSSWGSVAGAFPYSGFTYKDVKRDDSFLKLMLPVLKEFWQRVEERNPPPPSGPMDLPISKEIWAHETGETITLAGNTFERVDLWQDYKKQARDAEKQAKSIEAELRGIMQTATFGLLPGGRKLTLKETHRKAYTKTVEAGTYRTLRVAKAK